MNEFLKWLAIVMKYLPVVLAAVTGIQTAIPTAPGTAKLALATAVINPPEAEKAGVQTLISTVVTAQQAAGTMVKDQPVTTPAS